MRSADTARLGNGPWLNAERLNRSDYAIPSDSTIHAFNDASDEIEDTSDSIENAFDARYEPDSFIHCEDFREPTPTFDQEGTP